MIEKFQMKRLMIIMLVVMSGLPMAAQLNGSGYYRIRNVAYDKHYIAFANDLFNYTTVISSACGGLSQAYSSAGQARAMACAGIYLKTDIHLVEDAACVNPATVIYLKRNGNTAQYDLIGQSTSLIELTTGEYPGTFKLKFENVFATLMRKVNDGANSQYTASVQLKASNNSLADLGTRYFVDDNGFGVSASNSETNAKWYLEQVTSFNVDSASMVGYKGKYFCTMYTPFAYKLSGQTLKAWVITHIKADGTLTKEEIATTGGTVPAGTPVILECGSNEAGACTLVPQGEPLIDETSAYTGTNLLKGAYFCNTDGNLTYNKPSGTGTIAANNYTSYNSSSMLVLGVAESPAGINRLGFFPFTGNKMKSNKVWLDISGSSANANYTFDTDEPNQKGVTNE